MGGRREKEVCDQIREGAQLHQGEVRGQICREGELRHGQVRDPGSMANSATGKFRARFAERANFAMGKFKLEAQVNG